MSAFGAGITMAIASSLVLLVVSSVVAFNGWPDDLAGANAPDVAALAGAPEDSAPGVTAAARVAAIDLPGPPSSSSATGDDRRAPAAADGRVIVAGAEREATAADTPVAAPSPTPSGGPAPEEGSSRPASPAKPVADVVRETTDAVGDAVAPVAPAAGGALESVGAAGAEAVDQVGQTAAGAVQQLLP